MASSQPAALKNSDSILSVQELIKEPMIAIPKRYVRFQLPPTLLDGTPLPTIPIIDMKQLVSGEATDFELEKLHSTCKEWGLFQLVNHGVSSELLEKLKYEIDEFFKLPLEEKTKFKPRAGDVEGYGNFNPSEEKVDWGDRFLMIINPVHRRKPYLFPELPSSLRNTLESYFMELQKIGMKLLELIAKALKMDTKEMEEMFEDGMQLLRMTYYPPCPQPELVLGLRPHSDASAITILNQVNGVHGLQIKKDGAWMPVNFLLDAFVVNVGDILEILSNGVYKSIEHRVTVNSVEERISIGFFMNAKLEADIGPAYSLISPQNPPLFQRIEMEKYATNFFYRKFYGKSNLEHMRLKDGEGNTA